MINLMQGDCLELMKTIPSGSVDLILTDPPYNLAKANNFHTMGRTGIDFGEWDKGFDLFSYIDGLSRVCTKDANVVIFNSWKNVGEIAKYAESKGFVIKDMLRWEKSNPMPRNRDRRFVVDYEVAIWLTMPKAKWVFNRQSDKMKLLTQELKATYRANIRSADKISTDKAREIEAKQNTTDEEELQLVAFKIRSSLGFNLDHDIIEENIDMFENMPTLDRFARLMGYAFDIDDTDNNIALRRFYNAQIAAVGTIFENSDITTTFYGKAECDAMVSRVSDNKHRFLLSSLKLIPSRYGQWREAKNGDLLNMGMPSNTSKSVAQILDKYGLSWKRATKGGERGYRVNMDSWNKMQAYAERRYKKSPE